MRRMGCSRSRHHMPATEYIGRFAPSPTGPLHQGSVVAAIASYLDAKAHNGRWLVRIEDVDSPRTVPGAADAILRCLEALSLEWDGEVIHQSQRTHHYHDALAALQSRNATYPCACTRREIADSAVYGTDGPVYPGTCRNGLPAGRVARATRVRTAQSRIEFTDAIQGLVTQDLECDCGDFVVLRADGLFAYQLAVIVDDHLQGVTHVVRGADLLDSTPRQIHLQRLLGCATPQYAHVPVALNRNGEKLSKQTRAEAVSAGEAASAFVSALRFLGQPAPQELTGATTREIRDFAAAHWRRKAVRGIRAQCAE